jgi:tetratricopeptide (TPR) repeat protein
MINEYAKRVLPIRAFELGDHLETIAQRLFTNEPAHVDRDLIVTLPADIQPINAIDEMLAGIGGGCQACGGSKDAEGFCVSYAGVPGSLWLCPDCFRADRLLREEIESGRVHIASVADVLAGIRRNREYQAAAKIGREGIELHNRGDREAALRRFLQAMSIFKEQGETQDYQAALGNVATTLTDLGRYAEALSCHRQEEVLCRQHGFEADLGVCLYNQGRLHQLLGDKPTARSILRDAIGILARTNEYPDVEQQARERLQSLEDSWTVRVWRRFVSLRLARTRFVSHERTPGASSMLAQRVRQAHGGPAVDDKIHVVDEALKKDDQDLFEDVALSVYGKAMLPRPRSTLVEQGRRWFESKRPELVSVVCHNDRIRTLTRQDVPTHELVVAVCGVLDVGAHVLGGAPVITVAVLIVRLGLHHVCSDVWERQP